MRDRSRLTWVGAFFILSIVALVSLIFLFSLRQQLDRQNLFVMVFDGSLKGIHVGTPVEYRGIKVGEVEKIRIVLNRNRIVASMPVWVSFYNRLMVDKSYKVQPFTRQRVSLLIKNGLRAKLKNRNLLSNNQIIALVIKPTAPKKYHLHTPNEIPTIHKKSQQQQLTETLDAAKKTLNSITSTMNKAQKTIDLANRQIPPISHQVSSLLSELEKTAYHLSVLTDYLARHPESIITGKHKN